MMDAMETMDDDKQPRTEHDRRRRLLIGGFAVAAVVLTIGIIAATRGGGDTIATSGTLATTTTTAPPATTVAAQPLVRAETASTSSSSTTTTTTSLAPTTTTPDTTVVVHTTPRVEAPPKAPAAPNSVNRAGWIAIPGMNLSVEMFQWDAWKGLKELDYGPGHWNGTAEPGQVGNMVVGAHRTSHNHEFRYLDRLEPGDEIKVEDEAGNAFTYLVRETIIVQPEDVWIVNPTETPTITLFACHPLGSTKQRIVVFGDLKT